MARLSTLISIAGLLALAGGLVMFPAHTAEGTVFRWSYLLGGLVLAAICFVLAAKLGRDKG